VKAEDGTSVQTVTWEIVGGTLQFPAEVDFALSNKSFDGYKLPDTIYVSKAEGGKVKVRATLKNGGEDTDKNKIDIVSDVYEIVVGPNYFPGTAIKDSNELPKFGDNINNFWTKDDATTYPKYAVIAVYNGAGPFTSKPGAAANGVIDLSFNTGASAPNSESRKIDEVNVTIGSDGMLYFIVDLTGYTNYTKYMSDYGWGCQLCVWSYPSTVGQDVGGSPATADQLVSAATLFGPTYKIYIIKSKVSSLTKPGDAVDFGYTSGAVGSGNPAKGFYTQTLPVELSWE